MKGGFKLPSAGPGVGRLAQVLFVGGAAVYGFANGLFNVEGGHRCVTVVMVPGWASVGREAPSECAACRLQLYHTPSAQPGGGAASRQWIGLRNDGFGWPFGASACRRRPLPPADSTAAHRRARRAIVFNRITGIKDTVYEEGTHFMVPWFERPIVYDVRARPNVITSTSGSRDLQVRV